MGLESPTSPSNPLPLAGGCGSSPHPPAFQDSEKKREE